MTTEQVSKLPKVEVTLLRINVIGKVDKWYSSTNFKRIQEKLNAYMEVFGEENVEYDLKTVKAANTFESDENHEIDTLASFKNFLK